MNKLLNTFGTTLVILGFIAMAGSANDCDGACMEQANSLPVMLTVILGGLVSVALGAVMLAQGNKYEAQMGTSFVSDHTVVISADAECMFNYGHTMGPKLQSW